MEAGAPNADKSQSQSETPSTWVVHEPDAAAVSSTDWEETLQDGDKPRSCESASCKSAIVHLDSQGMEDDDVTLESPPLGEIEEQSTEGDPGASRARSLPAHNDVASATAAAEDVGGSLSTETLGPQKADARLGRCHRTCEAASIPCPCRGSKLNAPLFCGLAWAMPPQ